MIPVYQTKFSKDDGDCIQAALASIWEIALEDAPDFTGELDTGEWVGHLNRWLAVQHLEIWVAPLGAEILPWMRGHYIQEIKSGVDETRHVVVALEDRLVHDPHPGPNGIGEFTDRWFVVRRDSWWKRLTRETRHARNNRKPRGARLA